MTRIQIELSDATAQAAGYLASVADEVAGAGVAAMSMEEINAEVKAARKERRAGRPLHGSWRK